MALRDSDRNRLTKSALKLVLFRAFDTSGVEFKSIHAFRCASGIECLRQGGQVEDLRVLTGWRSPEMIRRYVKAAEVERATAATMADIADPAPAAHLLAKLGAVISRNTVQGEGEDL